MSESASEGQRATGSIRCATISARYAGRTSDGPSVIHAMPWTDKIYARSPGYVSREVAGEFILVPIRRRLNEVASLYVLNETGAALWRRIDGKRSAREVIAAFSEQFAVTSEQIEKDFNSLIEDLLSINAIEEASLRSDD
jgi:Coenzyme PQQ synthesis protein D (PqqD)